MRRFSFPAGSLCLLLALVAVGCSDSTDDRSTFAATPLSGANEVPPNASTATGPASFELSGNTVTYTLELHGITGVTAAHIHSGAAGANGPIRVILFAGTATGLVDGTLVQSSFTRADVRDITFETLMDELRNRGAYVNVHPRRSPTERCAPRSSACRSDAAIPLANTGTRIDLNADVGRGPRRRP